jgi:hypothetical protein
MEFKWIIIFLVLCNIIITILLLKKKNIQYYTATPSNISPCGLGCITYLAKNKVCSIQDVENINKGSSISPTCALYMAACATAYCCSPFCAKKQQKCTQAVDPNPVLNNLEAINDLEYYFPL